MPQKAVSKNRKCKLHPKEMTAGYKSLTSPRVMVVRSAAAISGQVRVWFTRQCPVSTATARGDTA